MWRRVRILLAARLASGPRGGLPVAPLLLQGLVAAVLCGLVRDVLPPFAYGLAALSLTAALLAIPLLAELGWLLRADEAEEWSAALPLRPAEIRLARTLHLLVVLWTLALGSLVPAAVLAPDAASRLLLVPLGLGLATALAALLLLLQGLLAGRAEGVLVLLQTLLVVGVVVGLVVGLRWVPVLADVPALGESGSGWLGLFPPAWFAAPLARAGSGSGARLLWPCVAATALALAVLALAPMPAAAPRGRREQLVARLLRPVRALATRLWVRADERAAFDLVYDALPREREVVLRTYPMFGIPLAFLVAAATDSDPSSASQRADLLALLLFTPGIYLPILLTHVPASASHAASWLLACAPIREGAVVVGAVKALAIRFLLPLYLLLGAIAAAQADLALALRLALPGAAISLLVLQRLYGVVVSGAPLSTAPDRVRTDLDWGGVLLVLAVALTFAAVLANRFVPTVAGGLTATAVLLVLVLAGERGLRRRLG